MRVGASPQKKNAGTPNSITILRAHLWGKFTFKNPHRKKEQNLGGTFFPKLTDVYMGFVEKKGEMWKIWTATHPPPPVVDPLGVVRQVNYAPIHLLPPSPLTG